MVLYEATHKILQANPGVYELRFEREGGVEPIRLVVV